MFDISELAFAALMTLMSQSRQTEREAYLTRSRSKRTRLNTAISNLLILIEEGTMSA